MLAFIGLIPLLIAGASAAPTTKPIQKRYDAVEIVSGKTGNILFADTRTVSGSRVFTASVEQGRGVTKWDINPGSGHIILSGDNLALDAGENPSNGGKLKVWDVLDVPQQTWYFTDDNRIAITGGNQCLDEGEDGVQTWECGTGNENQVWYVRSGTGEPPLSTTHGPIEATPY